MTATTNPAALAPQENTTQAAAARREITLWLVIEDEHGTVRRFATTADHAWAHFNNPYDHVTSEYETPSSSAGCYYEARDA